MAVVDAAGRSPALSAIVEHAVQHGPEWYGWQDPSRMRVTLGPGIRRVRCDLYRLDLSDGHRRASVMAKVRHCPPGRPVASDRPTIRPAETLPDVDLARLEFAGLGMGDGDDGRWASVRPLAVLPEHAAVMMDHVAGRTLRTALLNEARGRVRRNRSVDDSSWIAVGAWLRHYHGRRPAGATPATRTADRAAVLPLYGRLADYLGDRGGRKIALDRIATAAVELAERHLPVELPMVTGHGDFAPRNVLVDPDGRIAVIDPLPRWRVPAYEDLCRFVVNTRCVGLQVASRGVAFGKAQLQRYEDLFLHGYYGAEPVPLALYAYMALILLDKWSASVSTSGALRRYWADRFYLAEAARLLDVANRSGRTR